MVDKKTSNPLRDRADLDTKPVSDIVTYEVLEGVALVTLNNPPVNVLKKSLRVALSACLERAMHDTNVHSVVLRGAGKAFCAGANLGDFETDGLDEPSLHHTINEQIENLGKPVIAAIHGTAVGGGLELALSCHYRVCEPNAELGLPEITLGFFPGAGGTQKLPRALGLERALGLILSGRITRAEQFAGTPLVDAIVQGNLLEAALAFARDRHTVRPLPRLRDRVVEHPDAQALLQFARRAVAADKRAWPGALCAIDAIERSMGNYEEGVRFEIDSFRVQAATEPARALRYGFLAKAGARKIPGLAEHVRPRVPKRALVIGAGLMGTGIAICFAQAGIEVTLTDRDEAGLGRGMKTIDAYCLSQEKRLGVEGAKKLRSQFSFTLDEDVWGSADVLIEASFEDFGVKRAVLQKMATLARSDAILASNTSTLDLNALALATKRPTDVVGLHFFSPAQLMPLIEVVRTDHTSDEVLATAMNIGQMLRKTAVVARVCDGFIGNRILEGYMNQAYRMLEEGATPEQVDAAIENYGFAMGPFRMLDLVGNDVPWSARKHRYSAMGSAPMPHIADRLCEQGWFGQKTGQGWYRHEQGAKRPIPAQEVHDLIVRFSADQGIQRRPIEANEIVQRCLLALINESARVLGEGIALRGADIDVVYVAGYGFPAQKGGPVFQADEMGLMNVTRLLQRWHQKGGPDAEFWAPAPLLIQLVNSGARLRDVIAGQNTSASRVEGACA